VLGAIADWLKRKPENQDQEALDRTSSIHHQNLTEGLSTAFPAPRQHPRHPRHLPWSLEVAQFVGARKAAHRAARDNPSPANTATFRAARLKARAAIRELRVRALTDRLKSLVAAKARMRTLSNAVRTNQKPNRIHISILWEP